jgi:hypothetical protein
VASAGSLPGVLINKAAYDKLPTGQVHVQGSGHGDHDVGYTYFEYISGEYTNKFKAKGIKMTKLDEATIAKIQDLANKYMLADAEATPTTPQLAFSQAKYFKDIADGGRPDPLHLGPQSCQSGSDVR